MRGALVVLEGAEGVGKTTQLQRLAARLAATDQKITVVREPGGTPLGDVMRHLLLDAPHPVSARAEALLFLASRAQLVEDVILPALASGHVVLTDRFFLSTFAYQCAGRGLEEGVIGAMNHFATAALVPDLTLLIDLPDGAGIGRAAARGAPDRLERSGQAFHERVARAFRSFAAPAWQAQHPECGPIALVSGAGSPDEVTERIWGIACAELPETFRAAEGSDTR